MELLEQKAQKTNELSVDVGTLSPTSSNSAISGTQTKGSSVLDSNFNEAIGKNLGAIDTPSTKSEIAKTGAATGTDSSALDAKSEKTDSSKMGTCQFAGTPMCMCNKSKSTSETSTSPTGAPDDHDHAPKIVGNSSTHIALDGLQPAVTIDSTRVTKSSTGKLFTRLLSGSRTGDILDSRGGEKDVVIGGRGNDLIFGDLGGTNTITTGFGNDTIVLGKETTNRVFDFNVTRDRFLLADGLTMDDIMIVQGQNPGKGGLNQPLDSNNNTLIIHKETGHILGALTFTKAETLSARNFGTITNEELAVFREGNSLSRLFNRQEGAGQLNGTRGRDQMLGGDGNDFLHVGDDGFQVKTARGIDEFPFNTDSPGTTAVNAELKNGVLKINGTYKNFDGFPLFSQGETTIDPKAKILNGSNPQALVEGFLKVPQDIEGNPISGTHMHFSPAGDDRGNFADATVVRFLKNTPTDAKSGTISGEFELTPEEQAAFLAGNLYVNMHTNIDGDGDGRAGFPTGENRINFNRNVIRFV
jgi:hypothetical protein